MVTRFLSGQAQSHPAFPYIAPALESSLILVVGSYSLGTARPGSDLDVELIVPDDLYPGMLASAGGPGKLWINDEAHNPPVDVKVRPVAWLRRRLTGEDPMALWTYWQAEPLQDPTGDFGGWLAEGLARFREAAPAWVARHYRDLRSGVVIENARDPLARQVMLGKVLEAALVLPLLAQGEPYPYPKWQAWWLARRHAAGPEIVRLCGDVEARFRELRAVIDTVLTDAGYGESLIRGFWRKL